MSNELNLKNIINSENWSMLRSSQAAYGLVPLIQALGDNITCIEIGVNLGFNSYMLLENCSNISKLIGIDHYKEYQDWEGYIDQNMQDLVWNIFHENISALGPKFVLIKESSADAAKDIDDESIDFIFIDADHSMRAVLQDLDNYYPKLKPGGVISGHDANLFSVNFAVLSWAKRKGIELSRVQIVKNSSWWWQKV